MEIYVLFLFITIIFSLPNFDPMPTGHWARAKRRLFERLDPLATSALPRRRFESALAGTVTLSGLRLLLAEVVPGVSSGWKKWQVL